MAISAGLFHAAIFHTPRWMEPRNHLRRDHAAIRLDVVHRVANAGFGVMVAATVAFS